MGQFDPKKLPTWFNEEMTESNNRWTSLWRSYFNYKGTKNLSHRLTNLKFDFPQTWINFRAHTFANAFNWHMKIDAQAWAVPPCGVPAQDFNRKNQSWAYLCIYLLTDIWNWRSGLSRAVMSLARWRSACLRLSTKLSSFWRWLN